MAPDRAAAEAHAREYLAGQLGRRAPAGLVFEAGFDEAPLEGEGPAVVFSFEMEGWGCAPGSASEKRIEMERNDAGARIDTPAGRHYVVAGQTQPNYFPAYGLSADEAYSLHVGTRFALVVGLGLTDADREPADARVKLRRIVSEAAPATKITEESLAALFRAGDELYGVYRLRIGDDEVYFVGVDCAPGFYRRTDLPAPVVLRLHLGNLIRAEARDERTADPPAA